MSKTVKLRQALLKATILKQEFDALNEEISGLNIVKMRNDKGKEYADYMLKAFGVCEGVPMTQLDMLNAMTSVIENMDD